MIAKSLACVLALAVSALAAPPAEAESRYPDRPIRIVVPFAPGGVTDAQARRLGEKLAQSMGQQVIVDNRPGAGGTVGAAMVAKSAPDGYTLLLSTFGNAVNESLFDNLPYRFAKDFAPVAPLATVDNVLVVHPDVPAKTVRELVALAQSKPGALNFASSGIGGSVHMAGELFKMATGLDIVHVPYKGNVPAQLDLLAGRVEMEFDNIPSAIRHIQAGSLRALATTGPTRSKLLPDVPTMREAGFPDVEVIAWSGVAAPAGTPAPIVAKLNEEITKAMSQPDMVRQVEELGYSIMLSRPDEFGRFIEAEIEKWRRVVRSAGLRAE